MLKKLTTLLLGLLAAACLTATAWADYDYIDRYTVTATPLTEDGSLHITVELEWTALEELPYGQELKIGIPNGSLRDAAALTGNIERLDHDNSYMYVYLTQGYDAGETFTFAYSWVQEYMYRLDGASVTYDYTPGWFDEAKIAQMTLIWNDPQDVTGFLYSTGSGTMTPAEGGILVAAEDMSYGETMSVSARYDSWPTQLPQEYSRDSMPADDYYNDWDDGYYYEEDNGSAIVGIAVFVVLLIVVLLIVAKRGDGYDGGFGTRYVFVDHLWYPMGPDGRPRPGSVGLKEKPRPPRPPKSGGGGFGGGSRGGGFGGGGFGGGSHCACASSCACACACACAGGGRAGCSAKNLYGVRLDEDLSKKL